VPPFLKRGGKSKDLLFTPIIFINFSWIKKT